MAEMHPDIRAFKQDRTCKVLVFLFISWLSSFLILESQSGCASEPDQEPPVL